MQQWEKLGIIFYPDNHYTWMFSHASVPFATKVSEDLYKIYFSSRDRNNSSHIGYIIIDINKPQTILEISKEPILQLGELGTFDDSGTMLTWITNYQNKQYLYYVGWNLGVTVPFRNALGLAIGKQNSKFEKYAQGAILDRTIFEPHFVGSACILKEDVWKIWYLSCVKWEIVNHSPRHWYHIKYAESTDGINWERNGVVAIDFKSSEEYAISRPSVLKENGIYKMWYSYRGSSYRIGYAESEDGKNWQRLDESVGMEVSTSDWDCEMIEYPHVFYHQSQKYMLYNGNGYGRTGFGFAALV